MTLTLVPGTNFSDCVYPSDVREDDNFEYFLLVNGNFKILLAISKTIDTVHIGYNSYIKRYDNDLGEQKTIKINIMWKCDYFIRTFFHQDKFVFFTLNKTYVIHTKCNIICEFQNREDYYHGCSPTTDPKTIAYWIVSKPYKYNQPNSTDEVKYTTINMC